MVCAVVLAPNRVQTAHAPAHGVRGFAGALHVEHVCRGTAEIRHDAVEALPLGQLGEFLEHTLRGAAGDILALVDGERAEAAAPEQPRFTVTDPAMLVSAGTGWR